MESGVRLWALHRQSSINVKLTEQEKLFEVRLCFNRRDSQGYFFGYVLFFLTQLSIGWQAPSNSMFIKTVHLLSGALLFHQTGSFHTRVAAACCFSYNMLSTADKGLFTGVGSFT